MKLSETSARQQTAAGQNTEIRLNARAVSRGVAIGTIVCLHGKTRQFYRIVIPPEMIQAEIRRFQSAVRLASQRLKKLLSDKSSNMAASGTGIFETHGIILEDKSLHQLIENEIAEQMVNAEWAVKLVTDGYISKYKTIADEHFRERYIDVEDVAERMLVALGGDSKPNLQLDRNSIIAAKELRPSTIIELAQSNPKAFVTEHGGWTSHTFILAREMNLPAVTGLRNVFRRLKTGDGIIVDGYNGQVIVNPSEDSFREYKFAAARFQDISYNNLEPVPESLKTLDGRGIAIRANLDNASAYPAAKRLGAQGIGLYRSESLFNRSRRYPSESEQIEAYTEAGSLAGEDGVKIRTFDLGSNQLLDQSDAAEKNPALGLRAIRLSLANKNQLKIQIRAILKASYGNKIDIVLPMVSGVEEILQTRAVFEAERKLLTSRLVKIGEVKIGAMIEVPSAVFMIREILQEVDFLCLGTNDLVQYMLAVDRDNENVAQWFRTLDPAVLRAIKLVIDAADEAGKPLVVCGEMAGSAFYTPILIGLGATDFSMNANAIMRVRRVVSGIAYEEARELVKQIEPCRTADEIETVVETLVGKKWAHLYPPDFLRTRKT